MARRRHSKAFDQLSDADFAEYRTRCLARKGTYEAIVKWAAGKGVKLSPSMVQRDSQYFRQVEETKERLRASRQAAEEIVAAAMEDDSVAAMQSAATQIYTQMVMDFLIAEKTIALDDLTKYSKLGQALARLTHSQISVYRADVERRAAQAAEKAKALAGASKGNVRQQLNALAEEILGVSG